MFETFNALSVKYKIVAGIVVFLLLSNAIILMIKEATNDSQGEVITNNVAPSKSSVKTEISTPSNPNPVLSFNIPTLLGKNVDEVETIIGTAESTWEPTDLQLSLQNAEEILATKTFVKGNTELSVDYNARTRNVVDFFISTDSPSGATKDKQRLLLMGTLVENTGDYTVKFVPTKSDPSSFTGVIISPR